jgi:hypothetical protein
MNINKKFDRLKQWTHEKMGAEARTGLSDEFKALEMEMNLRHEGMPAVPPLATWTLTPRRHGQDAKVHGNLCQVALEACRGRRQGEAAPWRPSGLHHGHPRRGL